MPSVRPTSFRLTDDILNRLRALAEPREPMASVIERAIVALAAAPRPSPAGADTAARLDALEARVVTLEGATVRLPAVAADGPQPVVDAIASPAIETNPPPPPGNLMGWSIGIDPKGYIRGHKRLSGKMRSLYFGKVWDEAKAQGKIIAAEQKAKVG